MIDRSIQNNVEPKDFPDKIIIFTDMQFDEATDSRGVKRDMIDNINGLFETSPYTRPDIVCWNLRSTGNVSTTSECSGVALVSGFSKDTFNNILGNISLTPYDVMRTAIDNIRYDRLTV